MGKVKEHYLQDLEQQNDDECMEELYEELEVEKLRKAELFDEGHKLLKLFKEQCTHQDTYDLICDHLDKCCEFCETSCGHTWCPVINKK